MKIKLALIASRQGGIIFRHQAIDAGMSDAELRSLVRDGQWLAVRRGAYIDRAVWKGLSADDKHRVLVHAVAHRLDGTAVVSHISALVLHGLPTWEHDLSKVHVTRSGISKEEAGVKHHRGDLTSEDTVTVDHLTVTNPTRTIIESALLSSYEACLASADAALRDGLTTKDDLLVMLDTMRDWPGSRNAGRVVSLADGSSESVGESRSRLIMDEAGLPEPELQAELFDERGLIGRVDFLFREHHTIVEFDGKIKYGRELAPHGDPTEAVWQEKRREDRLRALGYEVVRITWADLENIPALVAKIKAAFDRAARRYGHPAVA